MRNIEFIVYISISKWEGGDVCVNMDVTEEEVKLLKKCYKEDIPIEDFEELSDFYNRLCEEAEAENEMILEEIDSDEEVEYCGFNVECPEELVEEVENEQALVIISKRNSDTGYLEKIVITNPLENGIAGLKQEIKDHLMDDYCIEDALSDEPTMAHDEGAISDLNDYLGEDNDDWDGVTSFYMYDQGCEFEIYTEDIEEFLETVFDELGDELMTVDDFIEAYSDDIEDEEIDTDDMDALKEFANDCDIFLYDPDDLDEDTISELIDRYQERQYNCC